MGTLSSLIFQLSVKKYRSENFCNLFIGGYVNEWGLCVDMLTREGWTPSYSIENILMQISVTIADSGTRAVKGTRLEEVEKYTKYLAKQLKNQLT